MSTPYPTLPIGPHEHIALDYDALRAEGLRLLGRLTGTRWTDYNAHDPGITILEQLCYAITELAYRASYPIPDLLAGTDLELAMPGPSAILTCDPVTPDDLRRLLLDVDGVRTAVCEPPGEPEPAVYHHPGSGELQLFADPGDVHARPLQIAGLARLALQSDRQQPASVVLARASAAAHARRGLGSDLELTLLATQDVWVRAKIEVGPVDDPAVLHVELLERIEAHIAPTVRFTSLADAGDAPWDVHLAGPALTHGLALGDLPTARRTVRASDILHVITDHPAVRAVRSLALATAPDARPEDWQQWQLELDDGRVATLAVGSPLTLLRGGLQLRVDPKRVQTLLAERRAAATIVRRVDPDPRPAPGRDRGLARYRSIQQQFPMIYGVGTDGLPGPADAPRTAQVRQLAAYLLIFDQLLANAFAQLAHTRDLLGPNAGPTYVAQPVTDLDLAALVRKTPVELQPWLTGLVQRAGADDDPLGRRKRFLAHLLARFAEHIGDSAQIGGASDGAGQALVEDRQAFLRQIPRLGSARGTGRDVLADLPSGLEQRLRLKLGLRERPRFHLVEHVLLRPIPEDRRQLGDDSLPQVPLLAAGSEPDPWSLQLSFVFETRPGGAPGDVFEDMVAAAILAETPAHLRPHLHWLDNLGEPTWDLFDAAWTAFRAALRAYRGAPCISDELHLHLRDARDRVIDLLGLGLPPGTPATATARTYPLRDLPVPPVVVALPNQRAAIPVDLSQPGVAYSLCDETKGLPVLDSNKREIRASGTGGTITLLTPPVLKDTFYRILAVKLAGQSGPQRREAWLHTLVRVEMGIDTAVVARLLLPPLEPATNPRPDAARIADFGAVVQVELLASQEGITYELVDDAERTRVLSHAPVIGTSKTILLTLGPVRDDLDLRVRGQRPGEAPETARLLTTILPLRVRANPATAVELRPAAIVEHGLVTTRSLLAPNAPPGTPAVCNNRYELGVKLRVDVAGKITGIRFYKSAVTPGEHSISLWKDPGPPLATAPVMNPPIGWNEARFPNPVAVVPGTTYIASFYTPSCGNSATDELFATTSIDRAPLHVATTADGGGAVMATSHTFPTNVRNSFYWLDVLFTPEVAPSALHLEDSQRDVTYRVFRRPIRDREFVLGDPGQTPTLDTADGDRTIRVAYPGPATWQELTAVGPGQPGTSTALDLPIGPSLEDAYLFVQATKLHRRAPGSDQRVPSIVQLTRVHPIFVRPDRDRSLVTHAWPTATTTGTKLLLDDGQPGVYYQLRAGTTPYARPAYFHQRDPDDPQINKGIRQLVIEVDLAIPRDLDDAKNRERTAPPDPLVDVTPQPLTAVTRVLATKAFSGVQAELARLVRWSPLPPLRAESPTLPTNGATNILVDNSIVGERYQLLRGDLVLTTVTGTGGTIALATGPLTTTTTFDIVCPRSDPTALPLVLHAAITVTVQ